MITRLLAVFLLLFPITARAATCVPLETIRKSVGDKSFATIDSATVAVNFVRIAGFNIPKDSHPIGLFVVRGKVNVMVGLIEPEDCATWIILSPIGVFERTMGQQL